MSSTEMTTLEIQTTALTTIRGIVTREQYIIILEYAIEMGTFLSFWGIISNIIVIKTFVEMGIYDGVVVSFLSLAIFDLIYLFAGLCLMITVTLHVAELRSSIFLPIQPLGLSIYFTSIMIILNVINILTRTYIAIARSMCVAKPLQFKNAFTRKRSVFFLICFTISSIVIYSPILANMGMSMKFDKLANRSRLIWWESPARETVKEVVWIFTEVILPLTTEFIVIFCVILMSTSLRASSRFRQSSTAVSRKVYEEVIKTKICLKKEVADGAMKSVLPHKRSNKEVRVVQQVVLISVVYVLCNIPKLFISIGSMSEPTFTIGKQNAYLYLSLNGIRTHFEELNSAVNLLIYYKYNTKFRNTLFRTFRQCIAKR
ncbi:unnamed protein product [Candidula unifasciata]|uniref:G-protein coupled receptors family 1 profile domain-containing protein n=1 Tax=Candidula unifasciata TaxID=100452 RepID=A0A8S3ZJL7_9EUPU|nr:unnamed protein product [Candidula unifasciata]